MLFPFRHGTDKLVSVAVRVPAPGIGVGPLVPGIWVQIIEDALNHAGVGQQPLHFVPVPGAAWKSRFAVQVKLFPDDGNFRMRFSFRRVGNQRKAP